MNRNITGTIKKTDGTVWDGAVLEFELERSSYDESAQYPNRVVRAVADENGEISVSLWINEDAHRPSRYICTLPDGSQFRFYLPAGFGNADLNDLRESAVEDDSPTQSTLVAFLPVVRNEAQQMANQVLTELEDDIALKADQTALDATNAFVGQLVDGVEALSGVVDTKAAQSALNTTNANLAALDAEVDTKAEQLALDTTNANVSDLSDSLFSANANLLSLTNGLTAANDDIATKASQADLNVTNANVAAIDATLDDTVTDLATANAAIAAKADQNSLNTTNANVTTLTSGLAAANDDIATRARQTALNTTNSNVTALSAVVDTKAPLSALNFAVVNLQNAIAAAQTTLQGLIDQKANLAHSHNASDIGGGINNSLAYFDENGELTGSDELIFDGTKVGLGTSAPQFSLDLQHPGAMSGNQSRITMILDNPAPIVQLTGDASTSSPPTINFECAGIANSIDSDANGILGLGLDGLTPGVMFRTVTGQLTFVGVKSGPDPPDEHDFDDNTFGFFLQSGGFEEPIGGLGDSFYLVVYSNGTFRALSFAK